MTDTTDIKALRSEAASIIGLLTTEGHQSFTLDKAADFFDDVFRLLEAERQRAESLSKSEWKMAGELSEQMQRAEKAELEQIKPLPIGELIQRLEGQTYEKWFSQSDLRGDQVPVTMDALRDAVAEMSGGLPMEWQEGNDKGHHAVPFINFNSLHRIVKKFTAPQKPFINKEKLCDWLEDNFDIDDSQRDAFADCFAHNCECIVKQESE